MKNQKKNTNNQPNVEIVFESSGTFSVVPPKNTSFSLNRLRIRDKIHTHT